MGQEYGAYRAEKEYYEQEQKIYPQDRPGIVFGILTIVFSFLGWGAAFLGFYACAVLFSIAGPSYSYTLTADILGMVGSIIALLLFVTIFVLSVISVARRGAHYRRPRIHRE